MLLANLDPLDTGAQVPADRPAPLDPQDRPLHMDQVPVFQALQVLQVLQDLQETATW